jgi:hypothetical protein
MLRIITGWILDIQGIVCVLHKLAEGIGPCKLDHRNADPKGNC